MNKKSIKVLDAVIQNTRKDVKELDGKPFNGVTVAQYLGNQSAAIVALADTIKLILLNNETPNSKS